MIDWFKYIASESGLLKTDCDEHGWVWDVGDPFGCPICYGINVERERIINLLDNYKMYRFEKEWVIELIEGDTE